MSVGDDGEVKLWAAGTGSLRRAVPAAAQVFDGCAISPNLKHVVIGGEAAVTFVDTATGSSRARKIDGDTWVNAAAFADTSKVLAAGGSDGILRIWSVASGRQLRQISGTFVRAKNNSRLSVPKRRPPQRRKTRTQPVRTRSSHWPSVRAIRCWPEAASAAG